MATVFVTHDFVEATALCDRCAIIDAGAILQDAPSAQIARTATNAARGGDRWRLGD